MFPSPKFQKYARCPKPRVFERIPAVASEKLAFLIGRMAPKEKRALAQIAATADLLIVEDRTWLLVPADRRLIDSLATFGAELEDLEPTDLEDGEEVDNDQNNDNPADVLALGDELEPNHVRPDRMSIVTGYQKADHLLAQEAKAKYRERHPDFFTLAELWRQGEQWDRKEAARRYAALHRDGRAT
ncbi:MAG: hypothetical protein AB7J30_12555 [Hyphomicrobium sp.]|uniref:hypothetical protein n=1 Tax=Hyphomicrobium sp. TaxID=82 RepID=UPI003D0FE36A